MKNVRIYDRIILNYDKMGGVLSILNEEGKICGVQNVEKNWMRMR